MSAIRGRRRFGAGHGGGFDLGVCAPYGRRSARNRALKAGGCGQGDFSPKAVVVDQGDDDSLLSFPSWLRETPPPLATPERPQTEYRVDAI